MQHFPKLLSSQIAFDIARVIMDGFDKHYRLFRQSSQAARRHFENMTWKQAQAEARERIAFYDRRVQECIQALEDEYDEAELTDAVWREVKLHYIGMLTEHSQPELAETFFNSVCCNILHRTYFNNDFIFVWPTISTEYIEPREGVPAYRVYYPGRDGLRSSLRRVITNFQFGGDFADLERDVALVEARLHLLLGGHPPEANHQIQVLSSPFMRNKGAYIIGRLINGNQLHGFVIPVLHNRSGEMYLDTVLTDTSQLTLLFSFTRAYFMVDMEVPSAYVKFLRTILPNKPRSEIYTVLGLHKQGKAAFYRDFLHHLANSSDNFAIAPGIRGLVMVVFALPSFPYVFKVIKDQFPAPKETTRELVKEKYLLVKYHDRVGRMADTLEYSNVAFPRSRFSDELLAELKEVAPSLIEEDRDQVIVKHLYIERRMTPLNIWLTDAERNGDEQKLEHGVREYGNAIKDLVAANIFPGDMLYKNFGVTRQGRVVFYDYDEIEYITDCNFRNIPAPRHEEDEMASEPWYHIAKNDVFPEQFGVFLLGNPKVRQYFMKYHAELLTADYWRERKQSIVDGQVPDTFPYPQEIRFIHHNGAAPATPSLTDTPAAPEAKAA